MLRTGLIPPYRIPSRADPRTPYRQVLTGVHIPRASETNKLRITRRPEVAVIAFELQPRLAITMSLVRIRYVFCLLSSTCDRTVRR